MGAVVVIFFDPGGTAINVCEMDRLSAWQYAERIEAGDTFAKGEWKKLITSRYEIPSLFGEFANVPATPARIWMLQAIFDNPRFQQQSFVPSAAQLARFGPAFCEMVALHPHALVMSAVARALCNDQQHVGWYVELAQRYECLPIPAWANMTESAEREKRKYVVTFAHSFVLCDHYRPAESDRRVPGHAWNFTQASLPALLRAAQNGHLIAEIVRQAPEKICRARTMWAERVFALIVVVSDGVVRVGAGAAPDVARFFAIAERLPLELQAHLAGRVFGSRPSTWLDDHRLRWALANGE